MEKSKTNKQTNKKKRKNTKIIIGSRDRCRGGWGLGGRVQRRQAQGKKKLVSEMP